MKMVKCITKPVTDYSIVYTVMVNFTKLVKQLKQNALTPL